MKQRIETSISISTGSISERARQEIGQTVTTYGSNLGLQVLAARWPWTWAQTSEIGSTLVDLGPQLVTSHVCVLTSQVLDFVPQIIL